MSFSAPTRRRAGALALALAGMLAGCEKEAAPTPPPAEPVQAQPPPEGQGAQPGQAAQQGQPAPAEPAKPATPQEVTLLITGSTNGQLSPTVEGEQSRGGAAELLGRWVAEEKHCAGQVKADGAAPCEDAGTLALATGDHWGGPAISSFFVGQSTAAVMARMGYAASALGNHELAFGRDNFLNNRQLGGFPFLAANLKVTDASLAKGMELPGFKVFDRRGLKVGVVGLTPTKTVTAAMAGRAEGLQALGYEEALAATIPEVWKAGADVVAVVADVCPAELEPVLAKHADWKVSLVAGGRCPQQNEVKETKAGDTTFVSLGRGFDKYLRAQVKFDSTKPAGQRVTGVETKIVDVAGGKDAPAPDAETVQLIAGWRQKLDQALGEEIGFTAKGLTKDSPEMSRWLTTAMQQVLKADVAVLNRGGIRQDLPAGKITRGSVYSVLPFENSLLLTKVKGEDLARQLARPEAVFAGATAAGKGRFKDAKGKALEPQREYTVATVEYLYFGGDGFEFEKLDPMATETGMAWQTPVIDWTKEQGTSEKKPLEKVLPKK